MAGRIFALVVKIAERCNLNCHYCYIYNHEDQSWRVRPKLMSDAVFEQMLLRMREYCDRHAPHQMGLTFHGGEPTLVGARRFDAMASKARALLGDRLFGISLQTNGTLVTDRWCEVLRRHGVRVGVSIDGPPAVHDAARVDHRGRGSHAATARGLRRLSEAGLVPSVLCVIVPGQSGVDAYDHFRALGMRRINFLLPDVSHDNKARFYGDYGPTPVADYLIPVFDRWMAEDDPDVMVRLFWGLIRGMLGGAQETDAFGNPLMSYLVIETDGAIEALDALRVCDAGVAASGLNVASHGFDDLTQGAPLVNRFVHEGVPLCGTCGACPERDICGGGYLPHRYARATGFDNPSVWCADIKRLIAHIRQRLDHAKSA